MAARAWITAVGFVVALGLLGSGSRVTHAQGPTIRLEPFATAFNNPIGIDFFEPIVGSGRLVLSVNYPSGLPHNLDLVDAAGGHAPFSTLAGEPDELKIATVRAGPCTGGFAVGTIFVGTGPRGDVSITKVAPDGTVTHPWVTLTGEATIRGSLYQDRACAFGGDLIVVTGNEQTPVNPSLNFYGSVWRVNAAGVATRIVALNKHLEGVITLPNDVAKYGPLAGRIVAGDEDWNAPAPPNGPYGKVIGVKSATDIITVGAMDPQFAAFPNYPTSAPLHPEDLDVINQARPNMPGDGDLFAVDYGGRQILTAPAIDFADKCGDILVTQEFPSAQVPSGLSTLRWNGASFEVTPLVNAGTAQVGHYEHVTFRGGTDCTRPNLVIQKVASRHVINAGEMASFTITVTNQGPGVATGVTMRDTLPAGLTWTHDKPGVCVIGGGQITCAIGTLTEGARFSVTLSAPTTIQDCRVIPNTATVSGTNEDPGKLGDNSASDSITVECPGPKHGCTPGFWKNHATNPPWGGYTPTQKIGTVFTIPSGIPSHLAFRNETLLDALQGGGGPGLDGKTRILLRAATAALLNADNGNPPYPISEAQVVSRTNSALASLNETTITTLASLLDTWNNQCDVGRPQPAPGSEPTRSDFDGDGRFDLLWHHQTTGQVQAWHMNGSQLIGGRWLKPDRVIDTNWTLRGAGDLNGDGQPDLVWQNTATGALIWWLMDGIEKSDWGYFSIARIQDLNWRIVSVRDFSGDGKPDLLWQHQATGELQAWYLDGTAVTSTLWLNPKQVRDTNWKVVGSADFDGDTRADIVWQNQATGDLILWFMNGISLVRWEYMSPSRLSDTSWRIVAVGDADNNGSADLVWQNHVTGDLVLWRMVGKGMAGWGYLSIPRIPDTNWKIVGPR